MSLTPPPSPVTPLLSGNIGLSAALFGRFFTWVLADGVRIGLILIVTLAAIKLFDGLVSRVFSLINGNLKPDAQQRVTQRTNTLSAMIISLGRVVIALMGGTAVLAHLGVNIAPIVASAGVVGVAVGFGAQSLIKDVINGFFFLIEDQFGVGDVIEVNGKSGLVERMNLRITQLRTGEGQLVTIPNGQILQVVNHSKEWARAVLEIGVADFEDPERVMALLQEIGAELRTELGDKILEDVEVAGIDAFKEGEFVIKLTIKTLPSEQWTVARAFRMKLWYRFKQAGVASPRRFYVAGKDEIASLIAQAPVPVERH